MPKRSSKRPKTPNRPSSKSTPSTDPAEAAARAVSFGRHARVLGILWIALGLSLTTMGGASLTRGPGDDPESVRPLVGLMVYGLGLVVVGVAAYRRSVRAILLGMGLSLAPVIYGYVAIPLTLIVLSSRAIRLSQPPRRRSRLMTVLGMLLGRGAIGMIAGSVGAMIGGLAGGAAGGLLGVIVGLARLVRIHGLDLINLASVGGILGSIGGAGGGGFSALAAGFTTGTLTPRVKAFAHLGGLVVGISLVAEWLLGNLTAATGFDAFTRTEVVVILGIALISSVIGTGLGVSLGARFARFLALPVENQAT